MDIHFFFPIAEATVSDDNNFCHSLFEGWASGVGQRVSCRVSSLDSANGHGVGFTLNGIGGILLHNFGKLGSDFALNLYEPIIPSLV